VGPGHASSTTANVKSRYYKIQSHGIHVLIKTRKIYGIIKMFCAPEEHNPPHFHAYYGEHVAVVDIDTCELKEGYLPKKQLKLVLAWAELKQEELVANWALAVNSELPFRIEPLK